MKSMSTIEEIKSAIQTLGEEQQAKLAEWFWHRDDDEWDRQMTADAAAGRLDHLLKEVDEDIDAGRLYDFPSDEAADQP